MFMNKPSDLCLDFEAKERQRPIGIDKTKVKLKTMTLILNPSKSLGNNVMM